MLKDHWTKQISLTVYVFLHLRTSYFFNNMVPACPNNLLLMALVFWCTAYGETINDTEINEWSDYKDTSHFEEDDFVGGDTEINNDSGSNDTSNFTATAEAGFHPPLIITRVLIENLPAKQPEDSCHDGSSLSCHNTSNSERNGTSDNKTVSEVAQMFLTSPISIIIIPSFYTAVCLLSVPPNICALLVFLRRIKPLNPAVICMLNLAFADLLFAMVLPFKIFYHFKGNDWIFGEAMCRLVAAAFYWNMYCSILLITLISVDRLLSVVYPMDSMSWRSTRKAFIACAAMWVLSFSGSVHILFTEQTVRVIKLGITTCHDIQPSHSFLYKMYYITSCVFLFFLPLLFTVVSYTRVIITLNKDQPGVPDASGGKRRAAMLTTTVLVMFVLFFTPTNIILIIHLMMYTGGENPVNQLDPEWLYVVYLVFLCLGSLNCVLDPLVYYFGSTQFQKEVCSMLRFNKTKQTTGRGQTSPGQSSPINSTNQTNTNSNCEANSK